MQDEWRDAVTRGMWIGLGGFLGANLRYWLGLWIQARAGHAFPWGTLAINLTGSLVLGILLSAGAGRGGAGLTLRLFLGVGLLGGYTTFSTFTAETLGQAESVGPASAAFYVVASVLGGLLAAWLGLRLGRFL